jgi:ectoine hydroxylase-related dioxygenase (phytanoyl-CoA dioxygenase family)
MPGKEYLYPLDVFLAFYFEDIDEDHGPTQILPGSHRDVSLRPNTDAPVESILLNMEDALLIDQRAWHRDHINIGVVNYQKLIFVLWK